MRDTTPPQEKYVYLANQAIPDDLEVLRAGNAEAATSIKRDLYTEYRTLTVLEWHLH